MSLEKMDNKLNNLAQNLTDEQLTNYIYELMDNKKDDVDKILSTLPARRRLQIIDKYNELVTKRHKEMMYGLYKDYAKTALLLAETQRFVVIPSSNKSEKEKRKLIKQTEEYIAKLVENAKLWGVTLEPIK